MLMKGLTERLTKHIIEESHPTVEGKRCVNRIQQKVSCKICEAACPMNVLEDLGNVDYTDCDDCGICVAHCPGGAITGSPIYVQRLVELAERSDSRVVLGCRSRETEADCKLGCLASYPWEILAALALKGNRISFLPGNCKNCSLESQMVFFRRSLERLRTFLGEERYQAALSEEDIPLLQNRREAFAELLQRGKRTAAAMLPQEFRQEADGDLWRKLLLFRLCNGREDTQAEQPEGVGWTAPIITEKCRACGICTKVCPNGALHVVPTEDGYFYMAHFGWRCRGCGLCGAVCPWEGIDGFGVVTMEKADRPMTTLTKAHACSSCAGPCFGEDELCMACKIKARGN